MSKKTLTLAEKIQIIREETITHGNEKVRVVDILADLAGLAGGGKSGEELQQKIDKILEVLSVDDEGLDTMQEIVNSLKNGDFLSNLPEEQKALLRGEQGRSAYEIWLGQGNEGTEQDFINSLKGEQRGEATATGSDFE